MKPHGSDFTPGTPYEVSQGSPGSWTEPAEPPGYCVPVGEISLTSPDDDPVEFSQGQLIIFDAPPDDSGWNGVGSGTITHILSISGREVRVALGLGEIVYAGPMPPQSQRGRG